MLCELLDIARTELKDKKLKCDEECKKTICPISNAPPFKVTPSESSKPELDSPPHVLVNIEGETVLYDSGTINK